MMNKKLIIALLLTLSAVSLWPQRAGDDTGTVPARELAAAPEELLRAHLSLIDSYIPRLHEAQNFEKYGVSAITGGASLLVSLLFYLNAPVLLPVTAASIVVLLWPNLTDMDLAVYDAMFADNDYELTLKIAAGDKFLREMRNRSLTLRAVGGTLSGMAGIFGLAAFLPGTLSRSSSHDTSLTIGAGVLCGVSALLFLLPSSTELQFDEYLKESEVFRH